MSVSETFKGFLFWKDFCVIRTRNIGYGLVFLQLRDTAIQKILAFNVHSNDTRSTTTWRILFITFDVDFKQKPLFSSF